MNWIKVIGTNYIRHIGHNMKLIYGTENISKINSMRNILDEINIEIEGLPKGLTSVEETGKHILENAQQKALHYYNQLKKPVFSADSGLYFDNVSEADQPGVKIRRIEGKRLSDEEMIDYYSNLSKKYGVLKARYRNAICLVLDENHVYTYDGDDIASEPFYIIDQPHPIRKEGFPLDSLSVEIESGKYYYDIEHEDSRWHTALGFRNFFERHLLNT